jgi:hypothetical protein
MIDEIQRVPELLLAIKREVDRLRTWHDHATGIGQAVAGDRG